MSKPVDFDRFVGNYNDLLKEGTAFFSARDAYFAEYKIQWLVRHLKSAPSRVLEYGCGIGRNIRYLKDAFPDAKIIGSDIANESLAVAREENPTVDFILERDFSLANDDRFDLIFVAGVFHHIPADERSEAMVSLRSRLRTGGQLIVYEHNPYNPVTQRIVSTCPYDEGVVLLKPKELSRLMSASGFSVMNTQYCLFVPPSLRWLTWLEPHLGWLPLGGQYVMQATC